VRLFSAKQDGQNGLGSFTTCFLAKSPRQSQDADETEGKDDQAAHQPDPDGPIGGDSHCRGG
jgi:hypothetical protein